MDSPDSSNRNTNQSVPAQDSPVFSYISNLSPIQPVKTTAVAQGFLGLSSPSLVFTSPRLNSRSQPTLFKSTQLHGLSAANLSRQEECCKSNVTPVIDKVSDSNVPVNDQVASHKAYSNQFFADVMNMDPSSSISSNIKNTEHIDKPPGAVTESKESAMKINYELNARMNEEAVHRPALPMQTEYVHKEATSFDANMIELGANRGDDLSADNHSNIEPESPVGHAVINPDQEDSVIEGVNSIQAATFDLSSHPGSMQIDEQSEYFVDAAGAVSTEPMLKKVRNDAKIDQALQHRGLHRRCLQFEDAPPKAVTKAPATSPAPANGKPADSITPASSPKNNFNSISQTPMPLRIGLHLNRFSNSGQAQFGTIPNAKSAQRDDSGIHGKKSIQMLNSHLSDNSKLSSMSSLVESFSSRSNGSRHESHASEITISATLLSTYTTKPPNNCVNLNPVEDQSTPGNKRKFRTENGGVSYEFNKASTTKKRKTFCDPSDADGCKRCNCKKSNCLKLYCDCFAAGLYCVEPCACQGCWNRPEYEDTVLDKRQQIESRNPLAFAPKVIQHSVEPPTSSCGENPIHFTPSSARHKRGCNCKKSTCLKKYCECYQANVGCSDGCRCEGCKNVFGQKRVYLASGNGLSHSEIQNPHNLTPQTPAFQFSNHRKDASEAWFPSQEYFQSPESDLTFIAPYNARMSETTNEIADMIPYDAGLDDGHAEPVNEVTVVSHHPGKMLLLTGIISNPRDWTNNTNNSSASSLSWRGLPNTPVAQYSGTNIMQDDDDDDTPDILKDDPTPLSAVRVSSPNKKRVSPPHGQLFRSSTSSLTSGRKFILQSIPSFPPLTPCIDSKISAAERSNDPKSCSSNKDTNH